MIEVLFRIPCLDRYGLNPRRRVIGGFNRLHGIACLVTITHPVNLIHLSLQGVFQFFSRSRSNADNDRVCIQQELITALLLSSNSYSFKKS
jgi:hypothetical protein